jgi:hypothetical protein
MNLLPVATRREEDELAVTILDDSRHVLLRDGCRGKVPPA